MSLYDWSTTPGSNGNIDAAINFLEGQAPSTVNNSARALMAEIKKWHLDITGALVSTGTGNSYEVSPTATVPALATGITLIFKADKTNTGNATFKVGSLTSKPIVLATGTEVPPLQIQQDYFYTVVYDLTNDVFVLTNPTIGPYMPAGVMWEYPGSTLPPGFIWANGVDQSRAQYPNLFVAYNTVHGPGDGATTFGIPDRQGRTSIGREGMGGVTPPGRVTTAGSGIDATTLGAVGGFQAVTLTVTQMPSHNHTGATGVQTSVITLPNTYRAAISAFATGTSGNTNIGEQTDSNNVPDHVHSIASQGGDQAHNNMPPSLVTNVIIKAH
jgi:microcystin-dependent protein